MKWIKRYISRSLAVEVIRNLNNGIPNALGPEIDGAADSSGSDCKQTGSCGCANGQVYRLPVIVVM
ncbi:MAG: hypothetical protein R2728_03940 [Chitinophagales bacterium]